ncbi:hypothetical protein M378DRAFT_377498 [Amanita muscaria Koide BX008]|uniref:Uncharacterized protein n=1 Tax=Amanita muscaria (strain Koide BX008) TaxID=946122 RepID=A0A0C2SU92_AMAMK|nr:hypothetical protein M378DRAFT_377498 [Amanita muscaria Koide BX008]
MDVEDDARYTDGCQYLKAQLHNHSLLSPSTPSTTSAPLRAKSLSWYPPFPLSPYCPFPHFPSIYLWYIRVFGNSFDSEGTTTCPIER